MNMAKIITQWERIVTPHLIVVIKRRLLANVHQRGCERVLGGGRRDSDVLLVVPG